MALLGLVVLDFTENIADAPQALNPSLLDCTVFVLNLLILYIVQWRAAQLVVLQSTEFVLSFFMSFLYRHWS